MVIVLKGLAQSKADYALALQFVENYAHEYEVHNKLKVSSKNK